MNKLLESQPQQGGEPVFDSPWQARTFAMAVKLSENGMFTWKEWADRFAANIAAHEQKGTVAGSDDYYRLWQLTLEELVAERG